jgi:hypothetical protein
MYQALIAASRTLQHVARLGIEADPVLFGVGSPYRDRGMQVRLQSPQEMNDHNFEGLSMWLYRVERDDMHLNAPPVRISATQQRREPLPLRLHYLCTPITSRDNEGDPETEQYVLGKVLQVFHSRPVLRGMDLQAEFAGTDTELHVRLETLTLDETSRVWDSLDSSYQLSVSYEVGIVTIASSLEPAGVVPVVAVLPEHHVVVG